MCWNIFTVNYIINFVLALPENILKLINDNSTIVLLTGLGGVPDSTLLSNIVQRLIEHEKDFIVVCSTLFKFESNAVQQIAGQIFQLYHNHLKFAFIDNDDLKNIVGNLSMREFFEVANNLFFESFLQLLESKPLQK